MLRHACVQRMVQYLRRFPPDTLPRVPYCIQPSGSTYIHTHLAALGPTLDHSDDSIKRTSLDYPYHLIVGRRRTGGKPSTWSFFRAAFLTTVTRAPRTCLVGSLWFFWRVRTVSATPTPAYCPHLPLLWLNRSDALDRHTTTPHLPLCQPDFSCT